MGSKSGVVKKEECLSILRETLCVNCSTCFLIHLRKASDDHLPIIMIENVGTPSKYMAIAAPDRIEWVPMSSFGKPSLFSPIAPAADRSLFLAVVADTQLMSVET